MKYLSQEWPPKKYGIGPAALAALLLFVGGVTAATPENPEPSLPVIDLGQIPDGTYEGIATNRGFAYQVSTTVHQHRITQIQILKNKTSRYGRKAEGLIPLILSQQKPDVDGIFGATRCSTGLKKAVADSLRKAQPGNP